MGPDVVLTPCANYAPETVAAALDRALEPLGGLSWVKPGMRIALKANLVSFLKPERAATTHPAVLCALTEKLAALGTEVVVGDSPGGLYTAAYVNRVYAAAGMKAVEQSGGRLNRSFEEREVHYPEGRACVGCGQCRDVCPGKAIAMRGGYPVIDRRKCIRCFCCQEFCPKSAMKVRRTAAARLLDR